MTIISLFVGLVEAICTVALPSVPNDLKSWIVFFLIVFPVANALLFYFVLIRYPQNFYGPKDFQKDESFLSSLQRIGNAPPEKPSIGQVVKSAVVVEAELQLAAQTKETSPAVKTWFDYLSNNEYATAIRLLNDKLSTETTEEQRVITKALIGEVMLRQDFQAGSRYFENLIEQFPSEQMYYSWLADSYLDHDLPEKCLNIVEIGLARAKETTRLITLKATCLEQTGHGSEAIIFLERSIEHSPADPSIYSTLIDIRLYRE